LPAGIGQVGGDNDEFRLALHPEDRHLAAKFHQAANSVDSFPAEYRIVRPDSSIVWLSGYGQVIERNADGTCRRLVNVVADVTSRKKKENHIRFLMREVSHRAKNLLAVIQSIAKQTVLTSNSSAEFQTKFEDRLQGIAASHDLLVEQNWQGAALGELVRRQLAPFVDEHSPRISIQGPDVQVSSSAAQAIGLALHELATNAVKYGALSTGDGAVSVSWNFDAADGGNPVLILIWAEIGGPPVAPPSRKGFGSVVIAKIAPLSVSGTAVLDYAPKGLNWKLTIPTSAIAPAFE
jgi:two-component sensor histidine kinase